MYRRVIVYGLICLIFVSLTSSEIHRAKVTPSKNGVKRDHSYVANNGDDLKLDTNSDQQGFGITMIKYDTWFYSIFAAMLVGLSGIFPLLVIPIEAGPSLKHGAPAAKLKLLLSFAVGGLLGDVFLHLLPEAWGYLDTTDIDDHSAHTQLGLWVIAGMLSFLIIEKMFAKEDEFEHLEDECAEAENEKLLESAIHNNIDSDHTLQTDCVASHTRQRTKQLIKNSEPVSNKNSDHLNNNKHTVLKSSNQTNGNSSVRSKKDLEEKKSTIKVSGYLNLAANVIDNFTHGLAVAGGFLVSSKVGVITTLAILLHEIPHEVGDFAILLRSGFDRWKAAKAQLLTATGGMFGALTALTADSAQAAGERTAWILPFTSGGFIYIALVTVVPDLLEEKHPKESTKQIVCLLAGIGVMYLVSLIH